MWLVLRSRYPLSRSRELRNIPCTITRFHQGRASSSSSPSTPQPPSDPPTEDADIDSLKPLSRPLGLHKPPTTKEQTWEERRDEMLDQTKRMEKRRHIVKQATQGYFHDFNRLKYHQGKTWLAPKSLIMKEKALYFPDIVGKVLKTNESAHTTDLCKGKISIIAFLTTQASEGHVKSFTERVLPAFTPRSEFQFVQINIQENPLKSFLVSLFLSSLRRTVPTLLQSTYLVSHQNLEYLHEDIGMVNKHVGYVYLVDEDLKIRWAGCANAQVEEEESLGKCVDVLLKRLEPGTPAKSTSDSN